MGRTSVLLLALALSPRLLPGAFAENNPSSPVHLQFKGSAVPVYDLSGGYRFEQQLFLRGGGTVNVSVPLAVTQDATGRLLGSGSTVVRVGRDSYAAKYVVSGRIAGGGRSTRAVMVVSLQGGQDTGAGAGSTLAASMRYDLEVARRGLQGTVRGSARVMELGRGSIRSRISGVPLPAGIDGSWSVEMDVLGVGWTVGSGTILLPNGRTLQANLSGDGGADSIVDRIRLSGVAPNRGNTVHLEYSPQSGTVEKLRGRVLGQGVSGALLAPAQYIGSQACLECHGPMVESLTNTLHTQAGVQCEDCHGPAADHAANPYDPLVRPTVDLTGTACGTCHSGAQHPVYEEWKTSRHAVVIEEVNSTNLIDSCGRCHSGSVRLSLLANAPLPYGNAAVSIGCPTCHEVHAPVSHPALLRNPLVSTQDYFLTTTTNFASAYNADINLCAQCHNHRGAAWTNTGRAPHHSLQYNMLLGTVGELDSGLSPNQPASHAAIDGQCAGCHMQTADYVSAQEPAITGHSFRVELYDTCFSCHPFPAELVDFTTLTVSNQIRQIKGYLDLWANTKAPAQLWTNYGARAWEYTIPGDLSPGGSGPSAGEQALIPTNIQKARFNLYLVLNDRSYGVHNGMYSITLLEAARYWIETELNN